MMIALLALVLYYAFTAYTGAQAEGADERGAEADLISKVAQQRNLAISEDDYPVINVSGYGRIDYVLLPAGPVIKRVNVQLTGMTTINLRALFGFSPSSAYLVTSLGNVIYVSGKEAGAFLNTTRASPGQTITLTVQKGEHPFYEIIWGNKPITYGNSSTNFCLKVPNGNIGEEVKALVVWFSKSWSFEGTASAYLTLVRPNLTTLPATNSNRGQVNSANIPPVISKGPAPRGTTTNSAPAPLWVAVSGLPVGAKAKITTPGLAFYLQDDQVRLTNYPPQDTSSSSITVGQTNYSFVKKINGQILVFSFSPAGYFITTSKIGAGNINPRGGWVPAGSSVAFEAWPGKDYQFSAWIGSGPSSYTGTSKIFVIRINSPVSEKAIFRPVSPRKAILS